MIFEKDIERYLRNQIEAMGGRCVKWGVSGEPDRIILIPPSLCCFVELKRPDGELSQLQLVKIAKLRMMGFKVYVPYNKTDVDLIVKECKLAKELMEVRNKYGKDEGGI